MSIKVNLTCDVCGKGILVDNNEAIDYLQKSQDPYHAHDINIGNIRFEHACPTCKKVLIDKVKEIMGSTPEKIQDDIALRERCHQSYLNSGTNPSIIRAIKTLREVTYLGLKEAKDICEYWRDHFHW